MADHTDVAPPPVRAKLWDLPTRIFHWALVVLVLVSWFSGGERMDVHRWSGYGVLGLVVFRLYWGVFGSQTARFASFVRGPKATLAYARTLGAKASPPSVGHNPLGALSVVAILALLVLQVSFGLFAVDIDGLESGPLSYMVAFDTGRLFAELHELSFRGLQALVVVHLAAVIFYAVHKRQDLIRPMFTGKRAFASDPGLSFAPWWRAGIGIVIAVAVAWVLAKGLRF